MVEDNILEKIDKNKQERIERVGKVNNNKVEVLNRDQNES